MITRLSFLVFLLALTTQTHSHPINFLRHLTGAAKSDMTWPLAWSWSWAWGDSTVSIVDRTPPLSFDSRPAAFGADISQPLLGYVIPLSSFTNPCTGNTSEPPVSPNLGCPKICVSGPYEPERTESWIALIQRGKCQFIDKVREAQRLGASAVVIGGDDPETSGNKDSLVTMFSAGDSSDVTIAATFIKYTAYNQLSSLIEKSNTSHSGLRTLSLLITADYSAWEWYSPVLTFAIILLLPSTLTLITLLVHRVRAARAAQRDRAPEDIVKQLPSYIWAGTGLEKQDDTNSEQDHTPTATSDNVDLEQGLTSPTSPSNSSSSSPLRAKLWHEQQVECAICLSEFARGDTVRVLPCHHIFHLDEVDAWLIHRKKLCPICKADVTHPLQKPPLTATEEQTQPAIIEETQAPATERTPLLSGPSASS